MLLYIITLNTQCRRVYDIQNTDTRYTIDFIIHET